MISEKEFVKGLIKHFEKHFNVYQEVWSKCRKKRIDLILVHKKYNLIAFGIECKMYDTKKGEEIGRFIKQAIDYKDMEFVFENRCKKVPIFICPALSINYLVLVKERVMDDNGIYWYRDRHEPNHQHHTANGILGAFGIGEVRNIKKGYYMSLSNFIIFESEPTIHETRSNYGMHLTNYNKILKK